MLVIGGVREDGGAERAVGTAVERFGGIDVVVDDAGAFELRTTRPVTFRCGLLT